MARRPGPRLILGTRKGVFVHELKKRGWKLRHLGHAGLPIPYAFLDARTDALWCSIDHGHWGQKLARSRDGGATYAPVEAPKYPAGAETKPGKPAVLRYVWCLAPGHASQPATLYLGTEPGGLFVTHDDGASFGLVEGLWNHPSRPERWFGGGRDDAGVHSVLVDPRNKDRVLAGISCAGVFETVDGGSSWTPRNVGLDANFLPDPKSDVGHDPHFVQWCAAEPDVVWQQNHCGIYRSKDGGRRWLAIHQKKGRARFGFPIAADPEDPRVAWVVPARSDEQRMAIDGALVVMRTENGGKSWQEQRRGLPQENAHDVVLRHALDQRGDMLAFGSTTGNVYWSQDRGRRWQVLGNNFPPVYSLRFAP